jgi:hypothetical protein
MAAGVKQAMNRVDPSPVDRPPFVKNTKAHPAAGACGARIRSTKSCDVSSFSFSSLESRSFLSFCIFCQHLTAIAFIRFISVIFRFWPRCRSLD